MTRVSTSRWLGLVAVTGALALGACATQPEHAAAPAPDPNLPFGAAVEQDLASQIVDPDVKYGPPPPADGRRATLAQYRYGRNQVVPPREAEASGGLKGAGGAGGGATDAAAAPPPQ
jgi:hypothetical protein